MSLLSVEHYTPPHGPPIDRAWHRLESDAKFYAEQFYIPDEQQDALPELDRFDRRGYTSPPEYVAEYMKEHPEYKGGTTDFVRWNIAARACWAGMVGGVDTNQPQSQTEQYLIVENLENCSIRNSATPKMPQQPYYVDLFTQKELSRYVQYWYRVGASDRLDGTIVRRDLEDRSEALAAEWPLLAESLDSGFNYPDMDQDPLPGLRDKAKERIQKLTEELRWREALRQALRSGALDNVSYGDVFYTEDITTLIKSAADLLHEPLPSEDSELYAELYAEVLYMNNMEVEERDNWYGDWEAAE